MQSALQSALKAQAAERREREQLERTLSEDRGRLASQLGANLSTDPEAPVAGIRAVARPLSRQEEPPLPAEQGLIAAALVEGHPLGPPLVHDSRVETPSFSPDGRRLFTVSWSRKIWVWEVPSGRLQNVLDSAAPKQGAAPQLPDPHDPPPLERTRESVGQRFYYPDYAEPSAALSPDGPRIVVTTDRNLPELWNLATGQRISVLQGARCSYEQASFSPDGERIVT